MATLTIESNGRIEKTAVYFNGEQISGIKELLVNFDEDGTYNAVMQYEGTDKKIYTSAIFEDFPQNIKVTEPVFTEEEAAYLINLTIESNGEIEETSVFIDDLQQEGIVSVFIHIKAVESKSGISGLFKGKKLSEKPDFVAQITYREEDESLTTEDIFL